MKMNKKQVIIISMVLIVIAFLAYFLLNKPEKEKKDYYSGENPYEFIDDGTYEYNEEEKTLIAIDESRSEISWKSFYPDFIDSSRNLELIEFKNSTRDLIRRVEVENTIISYKLGYAQPIIREVEMHEGKLVFTGWLYNWDSKSWQISVFTVGGDFSDLSDGLIVNNNNIELVEEKAVGLIEMDVRSFSIEEIQPLLKQGEQIAIEFMYDFEFEQDFHTLCQLEYDEVCTKLFLSSEYNGHLNESDPVKLDFNGVYYITSMSFNLFE
jgi:hypothetical protein